MKTAMIKSMINKIKIVLASLPLSLGLIALSPSPALAAAATYSLEVNDSSIAVNETTEVSVYVQSSDSDIGGGQLSFNIPSQLYYTTGSCSTGSFCPGSSFQNVMIMSGDSSGSNSLSIAFFNNGNNPNQGTKLLVAKIKLKGNSAGSASVTATNLLAADYSSPPVQLTTSNTSVSVTVTGGEQPPSDQDGDGIIDSNDSCPTQAEDMDGNSDGDGCPEEEQTNEEQNNNNSNTSNNNQSNSTARVTTPENPNESIEAPINEIVPSQPVGTKKPGQTTAQTAKPKSNTTSLVIAGASVASLGLAGGGVLLYKKGLFAAFVGRKKGIAALDGKFPATPTETTPIDAGKVINSSEESLITKVKGAEAGQPGEVVNPTKPPEEPKL
jgi:hypothetical protein